MSFGEIVKGERIKKELKPVQLANKINISRQYLCDIEKDRKLPGAKTLAKLDKVFPKAKLFDEYKKVT